MRLGKRWMHPFDKGVAASVLVQDRSHFKEKTETNSIRQD